MTERGEVRAGLNPNEKCNESREKETRVGREHAVVRRAVEEVRKLCGRGEEYARFEQEIKKDQLSNR